jgi:hypothetical protein
MLEIIRAMSFHSKNVWFRHYFKLKIEFIFKFLMRFFFPLNVAIDYFIKRKIKNLKENDK